MTEWTKRHEFHEIAEALGVDTDMIMAVYPRGKDTAILYTPEGHSEQDWLWLAILKRGKWGILEVAGRRKFKTVGEVNQELAEHMKEALGE